MALEIANVRIACVTIVDDDAESRQGYEYPVEDLELRPLPEVGPIGELEPFLEAVRQRSDAVICDHHLRKKNYASFNGAEAVAGWNVQGFPALLCTRYETAEIEEIRPFMASIPVMMKPNELNPDSMRDGFEKCIAEHRGDYRTNRRPWRSLVRVDDVVADGPNRWFGVVIPSWSSSEIIRVRLEDVPIPVRESIVPDTRLYAEVNLGAESPEQLYFKAWELRLP